MTVESRDGGVPPLVDVTWLREHHREVVLLQVDDDSAAYYDAHLPGAQPIATYDDLNEQVRRGPLDRQHFQELMRRKGITPDDHVVLLSAFPVGPDGVGNHAAFAYWLMRLHGHRCLSLLDGGLPAWVHAGGALEASVPDVPEVGPYDSGGGEPWALIGRDELLERFVDGPAGTVLLDCRTAAEYEGNGHHQLDVAVERHRVSGHIPGAENLPSSLMMDGIRFRPREELAELFASRGVREDTDVAVYCRVAERSALLWFALSELIGHHRVRHYVGGWAEYGSLLDVPVARG